MLANAWLAAIEEKNYANIMQNGEKSGQCLQHPLLVFMPFIHSSIHLFIIHIICSSLISQDLQTHTS